LNDLSVAYLKKLLKKIDRLESLFATDIGYDIASAKALGPGLAKIRQASKQIDVEIELKCLFDQAGNTVRKLVILSFLESHPSPIALGYLRSCLAASSQWVKRFAVAALVKLGDEPAKEVLQTAYTRNHDSMMKGVLTEALGHFSFSSIPDHLKAQLKDPETRLDALTILNRYQIGNVTEFLLEALADKDAGISGEAYRGLMEKKDPSAIPVLIAMLERPGPAARRNAAKLLGHYKSTEAIQALSNNLLTSKSITQRKNVCLALSRIGQPAAVAVDALSEIVGRNDEKPEICCAACAALAKLGDRRAIVPLARLIENYYTRSIQDYVYKRNVSAAEAIKRLATVQDAEIVIDLLKHGEDVQEVLAPWLVKHKIVEALAPLKAGVTGVTRSSARKVIEKAIYQLSSEAEKRLGKGAGFPSKKRPKRTEDFTTKDPEALALALKGADLGDLQRHNSVLIPMLWHENRKVRKAAAALFRKHDSVTAIDCLRKRLPGADNPGVEADVQAAHAMESLGAMRDESLCPLLNPLLLHEQAFIRETAARSLKTLGTSQEDIKAGKLLYRVLRYLKGGSVKAILSLGESAVRPLCELVAPERDCSGLELKTAAFCWRELGHQPRDGWEGTLVNFFHDEFEAIEVLGKEALPALLILYGKTYAEEQEKIANLLLSLDGPDYPYTIQAIITKHGKPNENLIPHVAGSMGGRLGSVIPYLGHEEELYRGKAASLLGATGDSRYVQPLLEALTREQGNPYGYHSSADLMCDALGAIGDQRAIPGLAAFLTSGHRRADSAAAALARIGGKGAIFAIRAGLQSQDTQSAAAHALALLEYQPDNDSERIIIAAQTGNTAVLSQYAKTDPVLVANTISSLPKNDYRSFEVVADARHPALATILVNGLTDSINSRIQHACREGLLAMDPLSATSALKTHLSGKPDPSNNAVLSKLMAELGTEHASTYFVELLNLVAAPGSKEIDSQLLKAALDYVGKAKVAKAVTPMISLVQSKSYNYPPVRRSMIKALWSLRAVEAIPALESLEPIEREESLNKLAAETLSRLRKILA
jgi:HEAT repeat protein